MNTNLSSESTLSMSNDAETTQSKKSGNVITDFKNAAYALLDALELGFFKEVELNGDGSLRKVKEGSIIPDALRLKRYKDGDLHIYIEIDGHVRCVEELSCKKGIFLDAKDAQRIQMEQKIEDLEEIKAQAEKHIRAHQEEIDELKRQIAKL